MRTEETLIMKFGFLGTTEEAVSTATFILDTELSDSENMRNAMVAFITAGKSIGEDLGDIFVRHLESKLPEE